MRLIFKLLLRLLTRYEVAGPIPQKPPEKLLIICNHQSFLDPIFIGVYCPFDIWWITHTLIAQQWHFRLLLKLVPHLVVDTANPMAMKQVVELINSGKPVCIFPEGRITTTGSLMKAYDGFAFLAAKTGAQLLPVNVDGLTRSYFTRLPPVFPKFLRPKVKVTFFPPLHLAEPEGKSGRERRRKASHQVRQILERNFFAAQPITNLFDKFLQAVETFGRKAEILSDIRFTPDSFGNVLKGALALGRIVSKISQPGEVVGVLMPNASPTVMLLFGMFGFKRVPAMINYTSGVDGMQSAIQTAQIKTIVSSKAFLEKAKLTEKIAQLSGVKVHLLEDLRPTFGLGDKLWLILWALRFPRAVMEDVRPDDPAVILFTSGSEGKPKGVVLSHRAIVSNIEQVKAVYEFSNRDKFLAALPLFHSFGLTVGALVPLTTGARVFLYPSPLHYRMIPEMAYDQDCTVLFGTSTFLSKYARMAHEYDFYRMRYVLSGAEKLSDAVRDEYIDKFGIRIMEGYGVTECSPVLAVNTPVFHRKGTVGRLMPMIEYEVSPVEGIEHGGMLHVRGPNLMSGYLLHDSPGKLHPPFSPVKGTGWYETGDIVEVDADGFVKILGRVKRFAKVAGEMVSLEVVEKMATLASANRQHAATTVSNANRGETILLYTEDKELKRDKLLAAARQAGMPEVAVPRFVKQVDKLPKLGSGKVDYVGLKEQAKKDFPRVTYSTREQRGWYVYDWANSAFYTTVVAVLLGPYLTEIAKTAVDASGNVPFFGLRVAAQSVWPYSVSLSVLLQVFFLPVVGAYADYGARKRELLGVLTLIGALTTIGLYFVQGSSFMAGVLLYLLANLAYGCCITVYNSFLPEIAPPEQRDSVSARGWAIGYFGGGLLLAINLWMYSNAEKLGMTGGQAVRVGLASAGVWWLVFSIIPMLTLRNRIPTKAPQPGESAVAAAIKQLLHTLSQLPKYPQTLLFLVAYLIYNDAIQTVFAMASQFGAEELKMSTADLTQAILMVQFVAFGGAIAFNWVAGWLGGRRTVMVTLAIWIFAVLLMYFWVYSVSQFYIAAAVVATVMGGSQALSRSLFSFMIPKGQEAEYYSVYEISDKGTSWLGPLFFGAALSLTHNFRIAIVSLAVFFVAGLILLSKVDVGKAAREAGNEPPLIT